MVVDTTYYINEAFHSGKSILLEGANAAMLDIDFGTYPFVTSSNTTISGVFSGLGLSPEKLKCTVGVVKAYTTRVGGGPFPTELENEIGEHIRKVGVEFGTTTGRPRRCGWLDLVVLKFTHMLNGYSFLNITKIDCLTGLKKLKIGVSYSIDGKKIPSMPGNVDDLEKVQVEYIEVDGWDEDITNVTKFEDLPPNCRKYIQLIEEHVRVPVKWIGLGPKRSQMIEL